MTMFVHSSLVLIAVVVAFAIGKKMKISTELSMFLSALIGLAVHVLAPQGVDPRSPLPFVEMIRHVVEGSFTYFDVCLTFLTATFFMMLYKESGGVAYIVRCIVRSFHAHRFVCLLFLTILMLVPGAITGSGATTVLTVGSLVGSVLMTMGVPEDRRVALIFLLAAMSAACPPINLWAMMAAAGANMPYVGFGAPLALMSIVGALFSTFWLAGRGKPIDVEQALKELPEAPAGWNWQRAVIPFAVLIGLILAGRAFPFSFPILGLPLVFMISALSVIVLSPIHLRIFAVARQTVENLLGLVGAMVVVGTLIQVLALSGARGLLSLMVVTLPLTVLFATLWIILPLSEGVLQYAVAPLFGVPLIMLFNMLGLDPIVSLSTWSVMWPVGDCLPPTAVVGRAAVMELDYKGSYWGGFVKTALVPMLFILAVCTACMVYSKELAAVIGG
ncbi:C4-dicarboxylate ABC transporter [Pyramidobacter sp.]|uniref:C4-dicarboxylate ABC transporter n=1 Tax=Pyramidobacter sp. TaxID=1943581 RepID=UPI0025F1278F|nr:C4-dicarboxylate ABC transporter [Pyramidobacter sp.]MCI7402518.1 C4-dicarboxylate ABC transporter [Pyramidobacter sp.]MDY3213015.1 C4-dicarboxylate ABC transporter [Pyramidobacter sp.]